MTMTTRPLISLLLGALLLTGLASEAVAQRGSSFRGGGGSVRYGGVRGDTSRRSYSRSNPGVATRANAGSIRAGRTPGASSGSGIRDRYPLETGAEAPAPGHSGTPAGTGARDSAVPTGGPGLASVGDSLPELPEDHSELRVKGKKFYYHLGLFYRPRFSFGAVEYERVEAPHGAILDETPEGAREVTVGKTTYREYADTWFKPIRRRNRQNWMVVKPPLKFD